ncbi:MAG: superoxide dismutase [Planctomycetes bacterium]|nr:superoxide dismutase [Planctomycetota bacterium]
MKIKLALATTALVVGVGLVAQRVAYSHCEIPCGIYGDKTRIVLLEEHIATVEKSMSQIQALTGKTDALSVNQLVRWVENKDEHADKIQHIVTQYFMTQRVKPKEADSPEYAKYLTQLTSLHEMLIGAMKCKQNVDPSHATALRASLDRFVAAYFSEEDQKHLKEHHDK